MNTDFDTATEQHWLNVWTFIVAGTGLVSLSMMLCFKYRDADKEQEKVQASKERQDLLAEY